MSDYQKVKEDQFKFGKELDPNEFPDEIFKVGVKGDFEKIRKITKLQDPANYWRVHERIIGALLLFSSGIYFLILLDQTQLVDKAIKTVIDFILMVWGMIF